MKKFEFEIAVPASTEAEAEEKLKALVTIMGKLSTDELKRIAGVVSNPVQLAIVKSKLL